MRLFTFSGIRGFFFGTNPGTGLINFAREVIKELPAAAKPEYDGVKNVDHFTSDVNIGSILTNPEATARPMDALNGFLRGSLAKKFQS